MTYPASNTGAHTWDEENVEEGFDSLVERTLEQNGLERDELSRDEANDIIMALGPHFSEDELHDFHNLRDVLLGVLDRENEGGTHWSLDYESGRGQVMEEAGRALRNNSAVELDTYQILPGDPTARAVFRYNEGEPLVDIEVGIPEDEISHRIRELADDPESIGYMAIEDEALEEVDYEEVIARNYNEVVAGNLEPLVEEGVIERETLQEYGLDPETAGVTDLTEVRLSDPSREELSEVMSALYQSVEDVESYQNRLSWNIMGASPFRDNEYTRA